MVRIDYYLFGYRVIKVKEECLNTFSGVLIKHGVCTSLKSGGEILVKERAYAEIKDKISDLTLSVSERLGLSYTLKKIKAHPGVIFALLLSLALYVLSADLIYEIRITGNENIRREEILEELSRAGLDIGNRWSETDRTEIEGALLSKSKSISWININRVGNVAEVSVIEKFYEEERPTDKGYSNIVAASDGVIEEIRVISGYPTVKVGDTVKKGDLLISGIIPDELGGGICHADGVILARAYSELTVTVNKSEQEKKYSESELFSVSIKIFNFSLNIFKKYGNVEQGCDIIEDVEDFVVFGKHRLPLSICKKYARKATLERVEYTDDEAIRVAVYRMQRLLNTALVGMDLVSIRTEGAFSDGSYRLTSKMTVITDIGESHRLTD